MMVAPFLVAFLAMIAIIYDRPAVGISLWLLTVGMLLGLFAAHATDPLALQF